MNNSWVISQYFAVPYEDSGPAFWSCCMTRFFALLNIHDLNYSWSQNCCTWLALQNSSGNADTLYWPYIRSEQTKEKKKNLFAKEINPWLGFVFKSAWKALSSLNGVSSENNQDPCVHSSCHIWRHIKKTSTCFFPGLTRIISTSVDYSLELAPFLIKGPFCTDLVS